MRTLALALLASIRIAHAGPESCAALKPVPWPKLSSYAQKRLPDGEAHEHRKDYSKLVVVLVVERAAHIAREVLAACPGVVVQTTAPNDPRNRTSVVQVTITSFAALSRMAQLPAVQSISIIDPQLRHKHFMPQPLIDPQ